MSDFELCSHFTFYDFIRGPANRAAFDAARAFLDAPANATKMLYLFGGTGLGKTHLINAVCNEWKERYPLKRVVTIQLETLNESFPSGFGRTIESSEVFAFEHIDFFCCHANHRTRRDFLQLLDLLQATRKFILISAVSPPENVPIFRHFWSTRYLGAKSIEVGIPDFATRMGILQFKAQKIGLRLSAETMEYLALRFPNNIRCMEVALQTIEYNQKLSPNKPDLGDIADWLRDLPMQASS